MERDCCCCWGAVEREEEAGVVTVVGWGMGVVVMAW